jgi:hypothetical protein
MTLEIENSGGGFLGAHIERDQSDGSIKLTQVGFSRESLLVLE